MSNPSRAARRGRRLAVGLTALAFGLTVLTLVVSTVHLAAQEKKGISPLRLVPEDAVEFVHINIADLMKSKIVQLLPARERQEMLAQSSFSLPADQIETVTFAFSQPSMLRGLIPFGPGAMDVPKAVTDPPVFKDKEIPAKDLPKDFLKDKDAPFKDRIKQEVKDKRPDQPATDKVPGGAVRGIL